MAKDWKHVVHTFFTRSHGAVTSDAKVDTLKDYFIPDYIFGTERAIWTDSHVPACPVMVFINSKSGGHLGGELLMTYRTLLNKNQVVDLRENAPDKVLHQLYVNLETHKKSGNKMSFEIQKRLRLIVAGGDGTANWLLGVVSDLKLAQPPPVATVPLGTGNNLPFSFGWGKKNPATDSQSVMMFLSKVRNAKEIEIDSWQILMNMRASKEGAFDPIAPLALPNSLHVFHGLSSTDTMNMEGRHTYRGGFWNYFSMGVDAEVSYAFHEQRKLHPERFKNQLVNQSTYAVIGCQQGLGASLFNASSRTVAKLVKVRVMKRLGHWEDVHIPHSIRAILRLNLPSFSGGLNPWGTPNNKRLHSTDFSPLYVDDGLIEVVGFQNIFHGLVLFSPKGHGTRLAQARKIRFEFKKDAVDHTYLRIDGKPWKQPLPMDDDSVVMEISHSGRVSMLASPPCPSKSINAPPSSYLPDEDVDEDSNEDLEDNSEGRSKLDAAEILRLPEGFDLSRLS